MGLKTAIYVIAQLASVATIATAREATEHPCSDRQLLGVGVVVGLPGTGDTFEGAPFTAQFIKTALDRGGTRDFAVAAFDQKAAAVIVTAKMKVCVVDGVVIYQQDHPISLRLSAMGNTKSLKGGALLMTPLRGEGTDARIYAIGQGVLVECSDATNQTPSLVMACVPDGGIVRR